MSFKNFKLETDADGIALVTWDIPGRSMNVLDETTIVEIEEIAKQTSADPAIKGVVLTSGKEAFSAGADLSMLEGMNHRYTELLKAEGEVAANQMLFDAVRKSDPSHVFPMVLRIHGGPTLTSEAMFDPFYQLAASHGYVVFAPNYRGSSNLGNAFEHAVFNDASVGPGTDIAALRVKDLTVATLQQAERSAPRPGDCAPAAGR